MSQRSTPARTSSSSASTSTLPPRITTTSATPRRVPAASGASLRVPPSTITSQRSRHSLYGTDDRVVLDLGSRIWKVGFSGEATPRACLSVVRMLAQETKGKGEECTIWELEKNEMGEEEWEIMEERIKIGLRNVWFNHLMTDPKSRKVIVIESPLLPTRIKEMLARILFSNLNIPSLSFSSSHLLALLAIGSTTGLVVDVGNLETTILPIYHSRPLFTHLITTPTAGARLTSRLRSLLVQFGAYVPAPSSLSSTTIHAPRRIPSELLSEELVEEIKTRLCFVGERVVGSDRVIAVDARGGMEVDSSDDEALDVSLLKAIERTYASSSVATTISFSIPSLSLPPPITGVGRGWIQIPGWIRERAAEVLFEESEGIDQRSVTESILESLLQLPMDLRRPLAESILIIGGTAMLPGFIPRLRSELLHRLFLSTPPIPPDPSILATSTNRVKNQSLAAKRLTNRLHLLRTSPRFAPLVPLGARLRLINSNAVSTGTYASSTSFAPSLIGWIGGSLAGSMKLAGEEMKKEKWEEIVRSGEKMRIMEDWSSKKWDAMLL